MSNNRTERHNPFGKEDLSNLTDLQYKVRIAIGSVVMGTLLTVGAGIPAHAAYEYFTHEDTSAGNTPDELFDNEDYVDITVSVDQQD